VCGRPSEGALRASSLHRAIIGKKRSRINEDGRLRQGQRRRRLS
jgi:hypothetical protein